MNAPTTARERPVDVVVVVPVHRNAATLGALVTRLHRALDHTPGGWAVRLVVDACPEGSAALATALAAGDPQVRVTVLTRNVGQHQALRRGMLDEPDARAWVCMDADLQDPPEAVPHLLAALHSSGADGVFAGRRGAYESRGRRLTGSAHRRVLAALTGLPTDAGAFLALAAPLRQAVLAAMSQGAPSIVVAAGVDPLRVVSIPVQRDTRTAGSSSWTPRARLRQSLRTLAWAGRRPAPARRPRSPRGTSAA